MKKADVVLFVMSTTGSNEKAENYNRMKEIADAGKKIIIVLNDKNGDLGRNDENIQLIKRQVATNMQKVGIENVDEKYCIVTVNAMRAKKGRTENKQNLLAKSGLDELKNVIVTELKKTTSFDILRGGIRQIENILDEFIKNLASNENSELVKNMNRVLENFNKQKISMRRQINTYIDTQAEFLGNNLPQIIWANRDNQDKINEVVGAEIQRLNEKVQREIQRQIQDAASILELELQTFSEIKIDAASVDAETFKNILSKLNTVNAQVNSTEIVAQDSNGTDLSNIGLVGGILTESAGAIMETEIGKALAKTALGKIIGGAIPVIGPILTIVSVLGALFGGGNDKEKLEAQIQARNEQERRRVEAEMQARQELNQKCLYLADNIAEELKSAADTGIAETLAKYEEPFKNSLKERQNENEQLSGDIVKLRELFNEYDLICVELGGK